MGPSTSVEAEAWHAAGDETRAAMAAAHAKAAGRGGATPLVSDRLRTA
ncbi:MAG TPA: hypothetical protein VI854_01010 [Acidimicrobiia bacterium]|nr:hypothetical protein [Acidimicrobiia bacterium]